MQQYPYINTFIWTAGTQPWGGLNQPIRFSFSFWSLKLEQGLSSSSKHWWKYTLALTFVSFPSILTVLLKDTARVLQWSLSAETIQHSQCKINCRIIFPAHTMITKHDFILRGSCFCEKYRLLGNSNYGEVLGVRVLLGASSLECDSSWVRVLLGGSSPGWKFSCVRVLLGASSPGYTFSWVRFLLGASSTE